MNTDAKILIADDSLFMRGVLKDILQSIGMTNVVEAENGKEALEKYASEKPDLVLLDIIMPEIDGLEVLKKIGASGKVVVISAVGQEKMVEEAKQYGAVGYIIKPFDGKRVIDEVTKLLSSD